MGIEQNPLHTRQPVFLAIGVAPARLHKGKAAVRDKRWHGAAEEICRRNEIRVEDRDEWRVRMFEFEGEVSRLEARALAAMQNIEIDIFGNDTPDRTRERFVIAGAAIVENLDLQLVARPIEARGSAGDAHGESTFVAHRQLDEHFGQHLVGQGRHAKAWLRAEMAHEAQRQKLRRQKRKQDEHARQNTLQNQRQADQGSGPTFPTLASPCARRLRDGHVWGPGDAGPLRRGEFVLSRSEWQGPRRRFAPLNRGFCETLTGRGFRQRTERE